MTALDYFVMINFVFLFASFIEFAIVHWYTKIGTGDYFIPPLDIMKQIALAHAQNLNWFASKSQQAVDQRNRERENKRDDSDRMKVTNCHQRNQIEDEGRNRMDSIAWSQHPPPLIPGHHHHVHNGTPDHERDEDMSQERLIQQLNQEISDVQNILRSSTCSRNDAPSAAAAAAASVVPHKKKTTMMQGNAVSSKATTPTTREVNPIASAAAATTTPLLECQVDALLQYLPPFPDPPHCNNATTATAAATSSQVQVQQQQADGRSHYLPSAYETLYGQLDTSAYPHNRKVLQHGMKQGRGMRMKNESGEDPPHRHRHRSHSPAAAAVHHQHQVTKNSKSHSTREWDPPHPHAPATHLNPDAFLEPNFCPVHVREEEEEIFLLYPFLLFSFLSFRILLFFPLFSASIVHP
jgi:hypothetical protein